MFLWINVLIFFIWFIIVAHLVTVKKVWYMFVNWVVQCLFCWLTFLIVRLICSSTIQLVWRQIKIKRSPDEKPFKSEWELVHLNIVITKQGFIFLHVWRRGGLALDPSWNKSLFRVLSRAYRNWHIMWGLI